MEKITICKKCDYFIENGKIWYDQFCGYHKKEETINPVTGEKGYKSVNDLGTVYYTDNPYEYCRDINKGNCIHFKT